MRCLNSITDSMDMNLSKLQKIMEDRGGWCAAVHGVSKSWTEQQYNSYIQIRGHTLRIPGMIFHKI